MQDLRRRVFAYRAVRVGVRLPNPIAPYDFAFNKTSRHRGIAQNMRTALQRGILQSEDRTVVWYYIVRKHANMRRLSSFRVGELIFKRVQALPTFFCCCIFLVQHVPAWWRRIAAPFSLRGTRCTLCSISFRNFLPQASQRFLFGKQKYWFCSFQAKRNIGNTSALFQNVCRILILRNAGTVKGTLGRKTQCYTITINGFVSFFREIN